MANYSEDLLRLFKCYVDTVTAFLAYFADDKILQPSGKTFHSFLEDERHFFYHQFEQGKKPCCECPSHGCRINRTRTMNKMIVDCLYDSTGPVIPGHEVGRGSSIQQRCIHRYIAKNISIDDLDVTVICYLLFTKAAPNATETGHIETIKSYRNKICHMWSTPKSYTSINTYNTWTELETAVLGLSSRPALKKMMRSFFQTHRQYKIEKKESKSIAELLEKVEQMNEYLQMSSQDAENTTDLILAQTEKIETCIKNQMQEFCAALISQMPKLMTQSLKGTDQATQTDDYCDVERQGLYRYQMYQKGAPFTSRLGSEFYLSFTGKIICVGHQAVGKTAIITTLRGLKPTKKSTDDLDQHIIKAAIDTETMTWVCKELDVEHVAFRDLLSKPIFPSSMIDHVSVEVTEFTEPKQIDTSSSGATYRKQENTIPGHNKPRKSVFQWVKYMMGIEKADIGTVEELLKEAVLRGRKNPINSSLAPINMMDFECKTAFYSTHQSILNYRGIYVLAIDGSKDFDDELDLEMFIPGLYGKPTSRLTTLFWVSSIVSCSTGITDLFPKILVVCTHKDKVPKDLANEKINAIFNEMEKMFEHTSAMKHLVLEHRIFLNAMDPDDPEYELLKKVLVGLVCGQPTWGEKLPKSWIYLKLMINRSVEKGQVVMSMEELRAINLENPVQVLSEEKLQSFLKVQHSQGELIYFPLSALQENIVISPDFLVVALRCLFTDPSSFSGRRYVTIMSMQQSGILYQKDIDIIFKDSKKVLRHKKFLLNLLEHLGILAIPKRYDKNGAQQTLDFYYVPGLVTVAANTDYFQNSDSKVLGISFNFQSMMPLAIGYRLIASCIDMFEIKTYNGRPMLFSGMVVLNVKRDLDIAIFLKPARVDMFLLHNQSRFNIVRDTASGIAECLKDLLTNIFVNCNKTSETIKATEMPFSIEYPCFDCLSSCYSNDKDDWTCHHGYRITKELKHVWEINRMIVSCPEDCKGLSGADFYEIPTDLQLAKLAQQFTWNDMYCLLIQLGLTVCEIEEFQFDCGNNVLNVAFLCLRKWRIMTKGSVGDLLGAIKELDLDIHAACKMLRNRPMHDLNDIANMEPTDQLLDSIANEAITESLFLSIELGQSALLWLQMKVDREKITKINRRVLHEWRVQHPRKDQMKDLAQALCNVGLDIASFFEM